MFVHLRTDAPPRPRVRRVRALLCVGLIGWILGCGTPPEEPAPRLSLITRYWLPSPGDSASVAEAAAALHRAVAEALSDGVLAEGYPRPCGVLTHPPPTGPYFPECAESAPDPNALKLSGDDGDFIEFETVDYLNARPFTFEVYLLPDSDVAAREIAQLGTYPRIAIPPFPLRASNYRGVLMAIAAGIRSVGAVPLTP